MFTRVHKNHPREDMQKAIHNHLVEMMAKILIKNRLAITPAQITIMHETAKADIEHLEHEGNLKEYYNRLKAGQI
ncbi:MAG: hypothetical protein NC191_04420 [Muribaculaceae bacterium]|nr:hypothetical protein [Muribaculaceae bacterium]